MNVLIIGAGGREHAIAWKVTQSPRAKKVYCAPGNAGIAALAACVNIKVSDCAALADFALQHQIEYTIVGPEVPLADGIVDFFQTKGLKIFGPNKAAAQLEASKVFSKHIMQKYHVPTAACHVFTNSREAKAYVSSHSFVLPLVIKADGLAAGKGVMICSTPQEADAAVAQIMDDHVFGDAGAELIIEEFLQGEEASVMAFVSGQHYRIMVAAQDHKRIFDNDEGPNTGGMGAYAPAPVVTPAVLKKVEERIFKPMLAGLAKEGIHYEGVLYAGLMIDPAGDPQVIEFNCRFGDPETEVVLPLLKTDLMGIVESVVAGRLDKQPIEWYNRSAVSVVLASKGYPADYEKNKAIAGLDAAAGLDDITVFHAGTAAHSDGVVTAGGRVLAVTGLGADIASAIDHTYTAVRNIRFDGMQYRTDIGKKALYRA